MPNAVVAGDDNPARVTAGRDRVNGGWSASAGRNGSRVVGLLLTVATNRRNDSGEEFATAPMRLAALASPWFQVCQALKWVGCVGGSECEADPPFFCARSRFGGHVRGTDHSILTAPRGLIVRGSPLY